VPADVQPVVGALASQQSSGHICPLTRTGCYAAGPGGTRPWGRREFKNFVRRASVGFTLAADDFAMPYSPTSAKLLLVADRRHMPAEAGPTPLRRYRLARLRFEGRQQDEASHFEHLKRVYD
jgi:hypothetical protein